jgi:hypothetical protein
MILGTWWGYADANRTLVGAVVVIVLVAAVGFVVRRLLERRREDGRSRGDLAGRSKRPSAAQSGRFPRRR